MATLHGSWLVQPSGGYLFIWGETWRRMTPELSSKTEGVPSHPLAMTQEELTDFLGKNRISLAKFIDVGEQNGSRWVHQVISLPTQILEKGKASYPAYSGTSLEEIRLCTLQPWKVEGLCLNALEAVKFLQALPLGSFKAADAYVGPDLRFWSQVARWSLDLLARCKFLPTLQQEKNGVVVARWRSLLDSGVDRDRLAKFAATMPGSCRTYHLDFGLSEEENSKSKIQNAKLLEPEELLLGFLGSTVDVRVRSCLETPINRVSAQSPPPTEPTIRKWLQALGEKSATVEAAPQGWERLQAALQAWTEPVQDHLFSPSLVNSLALGEKLFFTCFVLQPPASSSSNWTLEYFLQADSDREFLVDAETIWKHAEARLVFKNRTIDHPQETFLRGLGLASRIYPPIQTSLQNRHPKSSTLTPVQVYEFINAAAWRLQDSGLGVVLPPFLANRDGKAPRLGLKIRAATPLAGGVGLQSLLDFEWELAIGEKTISKQEFDRLVALKTPFVQVNGEWIALQPSDIKAAQALLATPKQQVVLSLEDAVRLSTGDTKTIEKLPVVSFEASGALQGLLTTLTDNKTIEAIAPPASFHGQLRPYQARGVGWLSFLEGWGLGACLADDMGLGKSIETIAFLLHLQEQQKLDQPTLLVCPTSVLGNWEREVNKFGPTLKVLVHHGDKRAKGKAFAKAIKGNDLVVTSYALAFRDAETLKSISWRGVVLDEAQNIKNSESKQSQAVRQLKAGFRIALTGTPVENKLQELWSILDFLNPDYLGSRQFFQRRFAMPIEKYGDKDSLETLRSLVQPFILRRLKTDREIIQDLPEKLEMNVFCGLSSEQAALYQKLVDRSLEDINEAEGIKRHGMILTLLLRLKQICNHPAQYLKEDTLGTPQRSGKLLRLEEMIEEALEEGDRALIFTQFAEWGKLLKPYLESNMGWETLFLYGGTRKQQREEMIDRFQNDPQGPRIFILSLKAGGTGLNLTRANHVFHFDRWWNPAVENQATDRAFRIGQTRNVQVHKFVCTGTLEERINELIESKKALAEQTVDAGEQWLTQLDTDGLRNLLLLDRSAVIDEEE